MTDRQNSIQKTLAFWQARTSRTLTEEDALEIQQTLHEFYCIVRDWYLQDHPELAPALPDREAS